MNILLTVSYDGTNYCGWQRQMNGIAVQERLEDALGVIFKRRITVTGASRTDAGVHALSQRASFFTDTCRIPLDKLPDVVNTQLPQDIIVTAAEEVHESFHPRFGAKRKLYEYAVCNARFTDPRLRNYAWHVPYPLTLSNMREAAAYFEGEHDFAAFCASGSSAKTTTRTIYRLGVETTQRLGAVYPSVLTFSVEGNGFLYNMVRIIVGTLVYVGCGKLEPGSVEGILRSRDRALAGKTAPPQGLTLVNIWY